MHDRPERPKNECPERVCPSNSPDVCPHCRQEEDKLYWCDVCLATFTTKRCPRCGLKLKRVG